MKKNELASSSGVKSLEIPPEPEMAEIRTLPELLRPPPPTPTRAPMALELSYDVTLTGRNAGRETFGRLGSSGNIDSELNVVSVPALASCKIF